MKLIVTHRFEEPGDIIRLRFAALDGQHLPAFNAGAHLGLHLNDVTVDLWRQYSLCSDPEEVDYYEIGVLRDPKSRGGSEALHRLAKPGSCFTADGPRNYFPLMDGAEETILFGGGIGVTPMLAMAHQLYRRGRAFTLHYCTRSSRVTAFTTMIAQAPWCDRVILHHDDQPADQRLNLDRDLPAPSAATHIYICGPQGFMDWLITAAEKAGHRPGNIHREYFSAEADKTGESFEVEARASGVTVTVGPQDTIAKALARAGVRIEVKCEEGVCGTCVTDVLEGAPDHRDKFLTKDEREEGEMICACCSRCNSPKLVLDI